MGRGVIDVCAGTVFGQYLAARVPGGAPGARRADRRGGKALAAGRVGGCVFASRAEYVDRPCSARRVGNDGVRRRAGDAAVAMVSVGRYLVRAGNLDGNAPEGVPLRRHRSLRGGSGGFGVLRFEVARQVVGVGRDVAVVVRPFGQVAVGVVFVPLFGPRNERVRQFREVGRSEQPLEGVGLVEVDRVGDRRLEYLALGVVEVGQRVVVNAASVLAAHGLGVGVVGPARVGDGVFIGDAGQKCRFSFAINRQLRVAVVPRFAIRVDRARQVALGVVGVGD